MSRILRLFAVALVMTPTGLFAVDDAPLVVAVTPLEAVHIDGNRLDAAQPAAKAMEELLQAQLSDADHITLVERVRIDHVLKEQSLALSGLVDPATAVRVGQLLKADVVVVGRVRPLDANKRLATLRAVVVADTRVLWTAEAQGDDGALAGQAASLGAALSAALRHASSRPLPTTGVTPLLAVKHHERAAALRALGAAEEAATEEVLALRHDPGLIDAEVGFLAALAAAGFEGLASAEAQAAVERGAPSAAKIKEFTTRTAMPTPTLLVQSEDSLETGNLRRFIDLVERRARNAPAAESTKARKDCARAWRLLGDAYVAEHRDRKASEAYHEVLKRVWDLRATDPEVMIDPEFSFHRICDSLAARAIERSAYGSYLDFGLRSVLRAAVEQGGKLPEGAKLPLVVYAGELPLADRVLLPKSDRSWSLLVRIKPGALPVQARLTRCRFTGLENRNSWQNITQNFQGGVLNTRWIGSEADGVFARKGVAWPTAEQFGNDVVFGRQIYNGTLKPDELLTILEECRRRGEHDRGLVVREAMTKPAMLPAVGLQVEFVMPPGMSAPGFEPSPRARLAAGVYLLLAGRSNEARKEFQALERASSDSEATQLRDQSAELQALCGVRP